MTHTTPEVEEIVSNAGVLHRQLVLNVKNHPEVYDPACKVLENWIREKLTTLQAKHAEELEKAREEERERIHDAFINEFAGAGELWFPYVSEYDPYITKEDTIQVAEEYWETMINSLTPTKTDKQTEV